MGRGVAEIRPTSYAFKVLFQLFSADALLNTSQGPVQHPPTVAITLC